MESQSELVTKSDLKAALAAQDHRFEGRMDVLEQRLIDKFTDALRDTETKILQAFFLRFCRNQQLTSPPANIHFLP
jgi:hypothetical protein